MLDKIPVEFCSLIWFYLTRGDGSPFRGTSQKESPRRKMSMFWHDWKFNQPYRGRVEREKERESEKDRIKSVILSTWRSRDLTLLYAFSQRTLEGEQGGGPSSNNLQKQYYQFKQLFTVSTPHIYLCNILSNHNFYNDHVNLFNHTRLKAEV